MEQLTAFYPSDEAVMYFTADALMNTSPWDYYKEDGIVCLLFRYIFTHIYFSGYKKLFLSLCLYLFFFDSFSPSQKTLIPAASRAKELIYKILKESLDSLSLFLLIFILLLFLLLNNCQYSM